MATPFLSEIKIMSFGFPPKGWALCNGQLLPIAQNQALFSLLGTTYGGNGTVNFALPNIQGRAPIHMGSNYVLGSIAGEQNHTLLMNEMAAHSHTAQGSSGAGSTLLPGPTVVLGAVSNMYGAASSLTSLSPTTVGTAGSTQPHQNMQPFLTLSFCIALQGIFPSRN